jgi:hypothetical protein
LRKEQLVKSLLLASTALVLITGTALADHKHAKQPAAGHAAATCVALVFYFPERTNAKFCVANFGVANFRC